MSENKSSSSSSAGIGFSGLLTLVFVIAKLVGVISWSWWLVFLPVLATTILAIGFIVGLFIIAVIVNK